MINAGMLAHSMGIWMVLQHVIWVRMNMVHTPICTSTCHSFNADFNPVLGIW
jgi:hypothetical protein